MPKTKQYPSHLTKQWAPTISNIVVNGTKSYKKVLTQIQYNVLTNWMVGNLTQQNIAKKLNVHQTTIHKALFGNIDYSCNKRYGGIFKKIDKFDSGGYIIGVKNYLREK